MKRIAFIVAIVLIAGIAGGLYWYNSLNVDEMAPSRWFFRSLDDVKSIHVQTEGGAYTLVKVDGVWEAQVPGVSWNIKARVLSVKVAEYLSALSLLEPTHSIGGFNGNRSGENGFDTPGLTVILQFEKKDSMPLTIRFDSDETGREYGWNSENSAYIYEFDAGTMGKTGPAAEYFLDTRVFLFNEKKIDRVQLIQPFGSSWLVNKGEKGYTFSLPGYLKGKDASDSEIKLYVHALALLKAGKLLMEHLAAEKQMPVLTIKLWDKGVDVPHLVEFFTIKDDVANYLGRSSWLTLPFLLDVESVTQLVRSAFDVQGRHIFSLDISEVGYVVIFHGDKRYAIKREDAGWRLRGKEILLPGIDMSLWRFTELQFEALPLNNLATTAVELMRCRLLDSDKRLLKDMTFYADPELPQGQCWMKNGDGMYYPVSSRLLKDLQGMFPAVRSGNTEK